MNRTFSNELRAQLGLDIETRSPVTTAQKQALERTRAKLPPVTEDIELAVIKTDTAIKDLFQTVGTNTDGLPMRELEGLDKAVQRARGALVDNIAKLKEVEPSAPPPYEG